jgi:hypothetical protein
VELATLKVNCPDHFGLAGIGIEDDSEPTTIESPAYFFVAMMVAYSEECAISGASGECSLERFRAKYKAVSAGEMGDDAVVVRFYLRESPSRRAAVAYKINLASFSVVEVRQEPEGLTADSM